jgi:DNA mismatch repair ATPase MutS
VAQARATTPVGGTNGTPPKAKKLVPSAKQAQADATAKQQTADGLRGELAELKQQHPGRLLFFRTGSGYQLYEDQAKTAGKALGLVPAPKTNGLLHVAFAAHRLAEMAAKLQKVKLKATVVADEGGTRTFRELEQVLADEQSQPEGAVK